MREVDLNPPAMPDPGEGRRWHIKDRYYIDDLVLQERRTFLGIPYWVSLDDQSFIGYDRNDDDGVPFVERFSYQEWAAFLGDVILERHAEAIRLRREKYITRKAING
jgi:hypothetical protein